MNAVLKEIEEKIKFLENESKFLTQQDKQKVFISLNVFLRNLTQKTSSRKEYYKKVIEELKENILEKNKLLCIKETKGFRNFNNFFNEIKYLSLEDKKLNIQIERKKAFLKHLHKSINSLEEELGIDLSEYVDDLQNIEIYQAKLENLKNKKDERENKRSQFLREIRKSKIYLKDVFDSKFDGFNSAYGAEIIKEIKENKHNIKINAKFKKMSINELEKSVNLLHDLKKNKGMLLEIFLKEISVFSQILKKEILRSDDLFENKRVLNFLIEENEKEFKINFQNTIVEYNEFLNLLNEKPKFEIFSTEFDFNEHNFSILKQIQREIEVLKPKKIFFLKLIEEIKQREELCEKIREFEIKSSDPKRLKGSSLVLFKEEAFRKKMIPKLFETERLLLNSLLEYEQLFGPFVLKNVRYKNRLKKDINSRVNRK